MDDNRILFPQQPIVPVGRSQGKTSSYPTAAGSSAFQQLLDEKLNGVKFSNHAIQRLENRNININADRMDRLGDAIEKASKKGARESLILLDNLAFVVSIKNKTVITAMDGDSIKDNVFTNIDSAVIV